MHQQPSNDQININMQPITLLPIGLVSSTLTSLDDCPLQGNEGAPEASIIIDQKYRDALEGISAGDRVMVLTWLHIANRDVLQCYPRRQTAAPHVGVFATRSPDRPNPIGYHEVTVKDIRKDGVLSVFPLEVLHGTPVLDIKPVI